MVIPWWMWVVIPVVGLFALLSRAAAAFRQSVLNDYVDELKRCRPDVEIIATHPGSLGQGSAITFMMPSGFQGTLSLQKLAAALGAPEGRTPEGRKAVLAHWVGMLDEFEASNTFKLETAKPHIRPRLVNETMLPPDVFSSMPRRVLGDTGLWVVYVIDSPNTVAYITADHVATSGVGEPTLHEIALTNLRGITPPKAFDEAAAGGKLVAIKAGDTYDAARLLLVPERLTDGQELVAVVPDRDTLMLTTRNSDPRKDHDLARTIPAENPRLCSKPILVTSQGFSLLSD